MRRISNALFDEHELDFGEYDFVLQQSATSFERRMEEYAGPHVMDNCESLGMPWVINKSLDAKGDPKEFERETGTKAQLDGVLDSFLRKQDGHRRDVLDFALRGGDRLPAEEYESIRTRFRVFRYNSPDFVTRLMERSRPLLILPGQWLIQEQSAADAIVLLLKGEAEVSVGGQVVSIARTGVILGELALTREPGETPKMYTASVQACTFCEVRRIDRHALEGAFGTPDGQEQRNALKKAMKEDRMNRRRPANIHQQQGAVRSARDWAYERKLQKMDGPKASGPLAAGRKGYSLTETPSQRNSQGQLNSGAMSYVMSLGASPFRKQMTELSTKPANDDKSDMNMEPAKVRHSQGRRSTKNDRHSLTARASTPSARDSTRTSCADRDSVRTEVEVDLQEAGAKGGVVNDGKADTVSTKMDGDVTRTDLLPPSDHQGWYRITQEDGLFVRRGSDFSSEVERTLQCNEVIEAVDKKTNKEGKVSLKLKSGGWVTERDSGESGKILVEATDAPQFSADSGHRMWYRVKNSDLAIYNALECSPNAVFDTLPAGEVFEVTERKLNDNGQMCLFVEHLNGWATEYEAIGEERLAIQILPQIGEGLFYYRVAAAEGLPVRRQREPPAGKGHGEKPLRFLKRGETFLCTLRALCTNGSVALHVGDGWVSARRPPGRAGGCTQCILAEPIDGPAEIGYFGYQVIDPEGLLVREGLKLNAKGLRKLPRGSIFTSTARSKQGLSTRLFMGDGWASERAVARDGDVGEHLVAPVDDCLATLVTKSLQTSWYKVVAQSGAPIFDQSPPCDNIAPRETLPFGTVVAVDSISQDKESGRVWLHGVVDGSGGWLPNRAVQGEETGALLVQRVDAPPGAISSGWYISHNALKVHENLEPPSEVCRTLPPFVPFFVHERKKTAGGMRLYVGDGWVSERATNAHGALGGLLAEMTTAPTGKPKMPSYRLRQILEKRWNEAKGQPTRRKKELEAAFAVPVREETPEEAKQKAAEANAAELCGGQEEETYPTGTVQRAVLTYGNSNNYRPASAPTAERLAAANTHQEAAEAIWDELAGQLERLGYRERPMQTALQDDGFRNCQLDIQMPSGTSRAGSPVIELVPRPPSRGARPPKAPGARPASRAAGSRPQSRPQSRTGGHPPRPQSRASSAPEDQNRAHPPRPPSRAAAWEDAVQVEWVQTNKQDRVHPPRPQSRAATGWDDED